MPPRRVVVKSLQSSADATEQIIDQLSLRRNPWAALAAVSASGPGIFLCTVNLPL